MKYIDNFLNKITMYKLVLYYLILLLVVAGVLGFFGLAPLSPINLAFSTALILFVCYITNKIFSNTFAATTNTESIYITALILALIITPITPTNYTGVGFIIFASVWAMASKYIFNIGKKHIFNPVAFGVAVTAILLNQSATWWIGGNIYLAPLVIIGGLMIVRKIRRSDLIWSFTIVMFATTLITYSGTDYLTPIIQTIFHSAFFFFMFVMLTEPLTTPPTSFLRVIYGAIVGILFVPSFHIGSIEFAPETALLIGNVFSYLVSPKGRFVLTLKAIENQAAGVYDFVFNSDRKFNFKPGQYLEWTLGHKSPDNRGNRRYFTIASSPSEKEVRLGVKFYDNPSTYKQKLLSMKPGETISVSSLAGDFVMPNDTKKKLVFIAGGIGVTPFRSMIQDMIDENEKRDVVLLYSNKTVQEIAYKNIFDNAKSKLGIKVVYAVTDGVSTSPDIYVGRITEEFIQQQIPDFRERIFYISGPHGMVSAFESTLSDAGVPKRNIKIDFFPGFA